MSLFVYCTHRGLMTGAINIQTYITFTSNRITIEQKRALI